MNPLQAIIYWKMFWFRLVLSTVAIVAMAIDAGLAGVDNFDQLLTTQKISICCSVTGIVCLNIVSLLDKTYASLSSNGKTLGDTNGGNGNGGSPVPSQPTNPPMLGK